MIVSFLENRAGDACSVPSPIPLLPFSLTLPAFPRSFSVDPLAYERFKARFLTVLEYLPDVWLILHSGAVFSSSYAWKVPAVFRLSIAALGSLSLVMLPAMVKATSHALFHLMEDPAIKEEIILLERVLDLMYLTGMVLVFIAVGLNGLREMFERYALPTLYFQRIVAAISPWVGYLVRISIIPQAMDISSGMEFSAKLHRLLKKRTETEAEEILNAFKSYQRLCGKIEMGERDLEKTIKAIEGRVHSCFFLSCWKGRREARALAEEFHARSLIFISNQTLGFTANLTSVLGVVVATQTAIAPLFTIISSLFFIWQTHHRHISILTL